LNDIARKRITFYEESDPVIGEAENTNTAFDAVPQLHIKVSTH
jgi:hypothetical protein